MNTDEIITIKNNYGNISIFYIGYRYSKKTNLATAGKRSCAFRCINRKASCQSSISLETNVVDGINSIKVPYVCSHINIAHKDSCYKCSKSETENQQFLSKIKEKVHSDPNCKAQQLYVTEVQKALSSDDSLQHLNDYNDIKHVLKYARSKVRATIPSNNNRKEKVQCQFCCIDFTSFGLKRHQNKCKARIALSN